MPPRDRAGPGAGPWLQLRQRYGNAYGYGNAYRYGQPTRYWDGYRWRNGY